MPYIYLKFNCDTMKNLLLAFGVFLITSSMAAQGSASLDAGSIESQFDYLVNKSNNYQQYEVVPRDFLTKFYKNIADSLNSYNEEMTTLNNTIYTQNISVDSLESMVMALNRDLEKVNKEKNSFALFGVLLKKGTYNALMWSLILGLLGALLLFIFRFKRSHVLTAKAKDNLSKTKEEFDAFRKKTLEKEQKLMRRLQDELNKNEMNMG